MKIDILRYPLDEDWQRCLTLARQTQGKGDAPAVPSDEWKQKILKAEHSPIRTLMFTIRLSGIPYYSAMHFVRHKVGVEHYVQSQRSVEKREWQLQGEPVDYIMDINAAALIAMARKRLCYKADPFTRSVMLRIKYRVIDISPEFTDFLIPQCGYDEERCSEFKPCGHFSGDHNNESTRDSN